MAYYSLPMPLTLGQRRLRRLWEKGIGLPGDNAKILDVARHLTARIDAPVLGGIAVILHGYPRTTIDLDFYTPDRRVTDEQLLSAGARWYVAHREHVLNDVRVHMDTPEHEIHTVEKTYIIKWMHVVRLKDL